MQSPTLLILAAGMGSRYGGLKQIDPMGPSGETILDYSVFDALRAGFEKVVFVIREEFEAAFRESVGARFADRIEIAYAFQRLEDVPEGFPLPPDRRKPWGTAHAIRAARSVIAEPFAVVNADDFYGHDAYRQAARFLREEADPKHCCLVGYHLRNTLSEHGGVNRGVATLSDGFLRDVEEIIGIESPAEGTIAGRSVGGERRQLDPETIVSMNFWGFHPTFFAQLESCFETFLAARGQDPAAECYIPTVVDELIAAGRLRCRVLPTSGSWFGVTYPADKPMVVSALRRLIDAGDYPADLRRAASRSV